MSLSFFQGYKSYVSGGLIVLFAILFIFGTIDQETFLKLFAIFAGTGIVGLKSAISELAKSNA
jgi:hypothetical protein